MKAVIMAGGEGARLRPLTCVCPKPMTPVLDRPVMAYTLDLLGRHGIKEAAVTLMYLPDQIINYFGDGSDWGVSLTYFTEKTPLGTAGSIAQAASFVDETTVVLSGDGLTDCDLTAALAFHREKGALATLVLKKACTPLEYGVVLTDSEGRVERFVEKPGWGEVCSDNVNTGLYILEPEAISMIPRGRPCDFGRDFFPRLVREEKKVYGWEMNGYWCDVGDPAAYLKANADLLDGRMSLDLSVRPGSVNRMPGSLVDKSAILEAPCYIGPGAKVEAGARIGPYSVLGAGCQVGEGASVKRSVLMRGAKVEPLGQIRGSILCSGAKTMQRACAFEESVIGEGSVLGETSVLMPGIKIWPHKTVDDAEKIDQNVVWGGQPLRMTDGIFRTESPALLVRQMQALVESLGLRETVLGRDTSAVGLALSHAAQSALIAQGVQVIDLGTASVAQLRFAQNLCGAKSAVHIARDRVLPMGEGGALLDRAQQRKLLGAMQREDYAAPFSGVTKPPRRMEGTDLGYIQSLLVSSGAHSAPMKELQAALYCQHEQILSLAERAFRRAGCMVRAEWEEELMELGPHELGIWLSDTGEHVAFADESGMLTEAESTVLICWAALESGADTLVLPRGATRCVKDLAQQYGAEVMMTGSGDAAWQKGLSEYAPETFPLLFDGIHAALSVCARLCLHGITLRDVLLQFPKTVRRVQTVPVRLRDKGWLLREMADHIPDAVLSDGLTLERDDAWAWVSPGGDKQELVVTAESSNAEFAKELCDFCFREAQRILKEHT